MNQGLLGTAQSGESPEEQAGDTMPESELEDAQQDKPGLMGQAGPVEDDPTDTAPGELSPEDQKTFQMVMNQMKAVLFAPEVFPDIVKQIKSTLNGQVPFLGLSKAVAMVMNKVKGDSIKAGVEVSDDVMLAACAEMVGDLATIADKYQIYTFPQGMVDGAHIRAVDIYREQEQKAGRLDVDKHKQIFNGMIQADKQGVLLKQLGLNRHQRRTAMSGARKNG